HAGMWIEHQQLVPARERSVDQVAADDSQLARDHDPHRCRPFTAPCARALLLRAADTARIGRQGQRRRAWLRQVWQWGGLLRARRRDAFDATRVVGDSAGLRLRALVAWALLCDAPRSNSRGRLLQLTATRHLVWIGPKAKGAELVPCAPYATR